MSDEERVEGIYPIGKGVIGAVWLFATACFFPPFETTTAGPIGRSIFVVLAITHAFECVGFLGVLRKSSRPLAEELWQTFLFGIVHISILRVEQNEGPGEDA